MKFSATLGLKNNRRGTSRETFYQELGIESF